MFAILQRGGADMAQLGVPDSRTDRDDDEVWDYIEVPKARARRAAWRNSVIDASQQEYLPFRFFGPGMALDENQKPHTLRNWLDSLVKAKETHSQPNVLNMIVPGNVGSGKTAAVFALGNEAVEAGLDTLMVKHSTYVSWCRPDSAPRGMSKFKVREMFVKCDLLILDELCGEMDTTATEFTRRETVDLIDSRISSGRPTAYTTNLRSRSQPGSRTVGIVDILGQPLLSRLESSAHVLRIMGEDRRKPAKPLDW
ncbi:ATP-binding protein [Streptomyces phaeochromogenes]|uniref:ATP-binding protein n=1 Tax=Streptomyces phaeochromogenes TaxID=1923 RepID=UPI0036A5F131